MLTCSVCYDATDLDLAADLRNRSDVYAICAINKDISTFDTMTQALHYHMYQLVVLANNGTFGGSNAYVPYNLHYHRQIFHLHGQPQASLAFLEIDNPQDLIRRGTRRAKRWKPPPAGRNG
jgi:hypothetical protein